MTNTNAGFGGALVAAFGVGAQALGAFFGAQAARIQGRMEAQNLEFQSSLASINARAAERDADRVLQAGQREANRVQLMHRQAQEAQRVRTARAGVQAGVGSAAEVQASFELAEQLDTLTINANAVRAANAARMRGTNFRNEARLRSGSARDVRGASRSISSGLAGATSLLGGATRVSAEWEAANRQRKIYTMLQERGQ